MSRRVALGKLGTDSGTAKYGLRVSRPSNDAVPAASSSATVAIDQLRFDSLNHVIGHTPIYKIYDVTVSAASVISGTSNLRHTPGTYAGTFGETLTYVPIPVVQSMDSGLVKQGMMLLIHNIL
jgi:hypothetical protein